MGETNPLVSHLSFFILKHKHILRFSWRNKLLMRGKSTTLSIYVECRRNLGTFVLLVEGNFLCSSSLVDPPMAHCEFDATLRRTNLIAIQECSYPNKCFKSSPNFWSLMLSCCCCIVLLWNVCSTMPCRILRANSLKLPTSLDHLKFILILS